VNAVTVEELKRRHDAGEEIVLLDVREPDELATAAIPWATWIPMAEIPGRLEELPRETPVVVMCHAGGRSARVTQFLEQNGFSNAANLTGGIDAWAETIEPTMARY
jgi:rhodanese-related sulfurtransferase